MMVNNSASSRKSKGDHPDGFILSHNRSFERNGRGEADLPDQLGIDLLTFRQHFHKLLYFGRTRLGFFRRLDSEDDGIAVHTV